RPRAPARTALLDAPDHQRPAPVLDPARKDRGPPRDPAPRRQAGRVRRRPRRRVRPDLLRDRLPGQHSVPPPRHRRVRKRRPRRRRRPLRAPSRQPLRLRDRQADAHPPLWRRPSAHRRGRAPGRVDPGAATFAPSAGRDPRAARDVASPRPPDRSADRHAPDSDPHPLPPLAAPDRGPALRQRGTRADPRAGGDRMKVETALPATDLEAPPAARPQFVAGHGLRLIADDGSEYLDAVSGTFNVPLGYDHPEV